jgi:hypothetical protein
MTTKAPKLNEEPINPHDTMHTPASGPSPSHSPKGADSGRDRDQARANLVAGLRLALAHESGVTLSAASAQELTAQQVKQQRISLVILRAKEQLGLSAQLAEELEADVASHLVAASMLITQSASLSRALTDAHIDHLIYKGAALGALQGGVSSRGAGDVDVLVEPENLPRVDRVLHDLGYRLAQQMPPLDHRASWKFLTAIDREVAYTGRPLGVDVHWRISPPRHLFATPRELFPRATTVEVGGVEVPTPAAGDALAMACFHAYYDRFSQLRAMVDVHRLIPLALQAPLPPLSPALGRLTAGVLTLHRELFPGIVDDEITELLTHLPRPLPMVSKVWQRCGADPACREATRRPGLLWQRFLAELAYDHPLEALPRWVAKRLVFFPPATAVGQHQSLPRAFGSQLVRIVQGRAS